MRRSSKPREITLPNNFTPRWYQRDAWAALDGGCTRAFHVWHRRAGKDVSYVNYTAKRAHTPKETGGYYHLLPTQKQARRVIWNGINKDGVRIIDQAFPKELRKRTLEDEMLIEFNCGSIWQCLGSDNYDSIVGTNPRGMVFSEWSISNPSAWDYMRPILTENGGWAVFIGTPRGKNWFHDQFKMVRNNPHWYADIKTVTDTGAISLDLIEQDRLSGMSEDRIQQEYWCSFDAKTIGLIYDSYIAAMEAQGRLTQIEYDPRYPVETAWDLGHRDATSIWFVQRINNQVRLIDYHEERGKGLPHFVGVIRNKPYVYSRHIGPHDTTKFEFGSNNTIQEIARQHGLQFTIAPKLDVEDGIEAVRALLPRISINTTNCLQGIRALRNYHYESDAEDQADDSKATLSSKPEHDWSSHCCDALRYLAVTPESQGLLQTWAVNDVSLAGHNWASEFAQQHAGRTQPWLRKQQTQVARTDDYDPLGMFSAH